VLGAVGSLAAQLAHRGGATVIGTVRRSAEVTDVAGADHVVPLEAADATGRIRAVAPDGVDRIIEVALSANADLDAGVLAQGAVIAAYSSPVDRVELPFWPLLFNNVTLRLLGSDDFPAEAKGRAALDLTAAAAAGALSVRIAGVLPLAETAAAHEMVESQVRGRVLVEVSGHRPAAEHLSGPEHT
jgi:NADPH2:quinone reductase